MNDVIEHLVSPWTVLDQLKGRLTKRGVIVLSIPNFRFWKNLREIVILGEWNYVESGILDRTHLRFFTYKSILKMLRDLQFEVITIEPMDKKGRAFLAVLNVLFLFRLWDLKFVHFTCVVRPINEQKRRGKTHLRSLVSRPTMISFISCVSSWDKYNSEAGSSIRALSFPTGFSYEQIPIENTGNLSSAAEALNQGIQRSTGTLLVLCHQDVVFPHNWVTRLLACIKEVEERIPDWGVIGLAGCTMNGSRSGHVFDPHGEFFYPPLPQKVQTLDELCLIMRKESDLRFDERFDHFHLYGADLCLTAIAKGMSCFAIDCTLEHTSRGYKGDAWYEQKEKLMRKWWPKRRLVGNRIYTTSGTIRLHSPFVRLLQRLSR